MTRTFTVYYSETGLTPTIRIRQVSDNSLVVEDANMTEVGDGWYKYVYADYVDGVQYVFVADGGVGLGAERYAYGGNESLSSDETETSAKQAIAVVESLVAGTTSVSGNTVTFRDADGNDFATMTYGGEGERTNFTLL
jgi:hypothetical protein